MKSSKAAVIMSTIWGKVQSVIGYLLVIVLFISLFGHSDQSSVDPVANVVMYIIFFSLGILLILSGAKIKHRIKRFRKYVGLISVDGLSSIDDIAVASSKSVDFVKKDLQKMIDKKFFSNAVLDDKANKIVIGRNEILAQSTPRPAPQEEHIENESVKCSGCGAVSFKRKGVSISCEYCGTDIR